MHYGSQILRSCYQVQFQGDITHYMQCSLVPQKLGILTYHNKSYFGLGLRLGVRVIKGKG